MLTVTEALRLAGLSGGMEYVTDHGLARGRAVHAAIALHHKGTLDYESLHDEVAPRLASWIAWAQAVGYEHERGEFECRGVNYIGHPDAVGMIRGDRWLLDFKGGSPAPWHAIQTALYAAAVGGINRRGAVYLHADGRMATLIEHDGRQDYAVGMGAVAVAGWKKKNGLG